MAEATGATEANTQNALFFCFFFCSCTTHARTHTPTNIDFQIKGRVIFAYLLFFLKQLGVEAFSKVLAHFR